LVVTFIFYNVAWLSKVLQHKECFNTWTKQLEFTVFLHREIIQHSPHSTCN